MKHLDNIHPDRFYTELVESAFLIHEVVEGKTESGEIQTVRLQLNLHFLV